MAGYRPKSLDELNSLYDKSKNAKNEISKKALDLEVKSEQFVPALTQTDVKPEEDEKSREETAAEEISGLVDDFIKSFGTPVPVKKVRPASVAATAVKSVSSAKVAEAKSPVQESTHSAQTDAPSSDKPRLIRSTERNELFEDYKKVMDDEGEDEGSRLRLGRRKGKKLFEKKNAQAYEGAEAKTQEPEAEANEAPAEISYEGIMPQQEASEPEIPETLENIDAVIEKVLGKPLNPYDKDEEAEEETVIVPEEEEPEEVIITEEAEIIEVTEELPESEEETTDVNEPDGTMAPDTAEEETEVIEATEEAQAVTEEASETETAEAYDDDYDEAPFDYIAAVYKESYNEENETNHDEHSADYVAGHSEDKKASAKKEKRKEKKEAKKQKKEKTRKPRSKKRFAGKNILLILLLLVLILATAVSAIKAFSGINSDTLMLDKYYLYTSDTTFTQAGINKGDLVVVSREGIKEGDIFAFKKGDGEYGFAKFESVLNDESIIADTDGQKSIVFRNTLRGTYFKSIPMVGTIAALIISDHLYIVGALALIAAILLIIIIFAFRTGKEKAPKISKKKDAASELEEVQENDEADDETTEEEKSPYDAVEDDFKYLIQEDGDDFDIYRNAPSDETDEDGLPVYPDDNYKYEPDEYVNN